MLNKVIIYLLLLLATNVYFWPEENNISGNLINEEVKLSDPIEITLTGEVAYPGIYTFYEEIMLRDVLDFAGGTTNNADLTLLNKNIYLKKSQTININSIGIISEPNHLGPFDLNQISKSEILNLVGVIKGLTLDRAINIIIYRQQNGIFSSVEDLLKVKEIGPASYAQISPYFKV